MASTLIYYVDNGLEINIDGIMQQKFGRHGSLSNFKALMRIVYIDISIAIVHHR